MSALSVDKVTAWAGQHGGNRRWPRCERWVPPEHPAIYRCTKNLGAVQPLLGHSKLESTATYLGIEVDDALKISEHDGCRRVCDGNRPLPPALVELEALSDKAVISALGWRVMRKKFWA
jgi:hypothetical protein